MLRSACLFFLVGGAGCTVTATPGPPAPTSSCEPDSVVTSECAGGTGYSCTGTDTPDETDSTLVCSQGETLTADEIGYCCVSAFASTSTCGEDPSVSGCEPPSIGFSCSGSDSPDQADATLTCSPGVPSGTATLYCCQ
jgi:hypothetical protein